MTKGVSPLIATVLLIAFTLSIAGLLGSWLSSMTKTQTENIGKSTVDVINCTNAILDIFQIACINSTLRVTISNIGSNTMFGFSTFAQIDSNQYINNTGGPNSTSPLMPGEQTVLVYGCQSICSNGTTISRVRVTPSNCPSSWTEKSTSITCT